MNPISVQDNLLLKGDRATGPRTLLDVLDETTRRFPHAVAIDDGHEIVTYGDLSARIAPLVEQLRAVGAGPGTRVAVRRTSGRVDLYAGILAILRAGAAYVPIDVDDPAERSELVCSEAGVVAILTDDGVDVVSEDPHHTPRTATDQAPGLEDDAWIIFTSGSTGTPKGVAVTHRSAAAFVDAERALFLRRAPLGPGDRVMAGLSVAFDASCEEMWLAWGTGATLVPAPRELVKTGLDVGPWLVERSITVVSTVPTLAGLWPAETLDRVRLLIFGGEGLPADLAARVCANGREVWNTYGPTEATVVTTAWQVVPGEPVRIGTPLDGWDAAVVGPDGLPVAPGEQGELVIGGVGLAHYLDPVKDAEKYAPMPGLGWDRAYRSGDLVSFDGTGLLFHGRIDDQVKIGGRRIELGEIDAALSALPGVASAAAAVRKTSAGHSLLVGYLVPTAGTKPDIAGWRGSLRQSLPAALVPQLHVMDDLPTRTSGKVDRNALPWPLQPQGKTSTPSEEPAQAARPAAATVTREWVADRMAAILGAAPEGDEDDFFTLGGGSLAAAQLVVHLRHVCPVVTVADVYDNPTVDELTARLHHLVGSSPAMEAPTVAKTGRPQAIPRLGLGTRLVQWCVAVIATVVKAARWWVNAVAAATVVQAIHPTSWLPAGSWSLVAVAVVLWLPATRVLLAAAVARLCTAGIKPGMYPRGGVVHVRIWAAEQGVDACGATSLSVAPMMTALARLLGASIGKDVHLHTFPPVTGLLEVGSEASIEPETDVSGVWVEGDWVHVGHIRVGPRASVGTRSTLAPGANVKKGSVVEPGSCVLGTVRGGATWAGSPAHGHSESIDEQWPADAAPHTHGWSLAYAVTASVIGALPVVAALPVGAVVLWLTPAVSSAQALAASWWTLIPALVVAWWFTLVLVVWATVRLLGVGITEGTWAVHSRRGWQVWATERVLDQARSWLYPLYASVATPAWLRALGATIGEGVEASTVLLIPAMTRVDDGAFLADDTLIAGYQLHRGWMRVARARVGKRAFLGNSGMAAAGRKVPKDGLVAVLSAAPHKSKKGTSWLGSPPTQLRRTSADVDASITYAPPRRLVWTRAAVELCRLVPVVLSGSIALGVWAVLLHTAASEPWWVSVGVTAAVLWLAGWLAALVATLAKWLLVGRIRRADHALWTSFIWRNELADAFVEVLAVPWFVAYRLGSGELNVWLRSLGARIGSSVWCETHWLPEADLVTLGKGCSVNRGCVVQTHLFHDRVMSLDTVTLGVGSTLGPHSVVLPAAQVSEHSTVGPGSLVLRGDHVPAESRWTGNPIAPWNVE